MHHLTWGHVAERFEPDGSLLDAYVLDADTTDWQQIIDLVRSHDEDLGRHLAGSTEAVRQESSRRQTH